jgi:hypothetical protein
VAAPVAAPVAERSRRRWAGFSVFLGVGASYLLLGVVLWWHAWASGAGTHTLCGCGDPALFLWFFQWPATAVAHLHNPFYSSALFHPGGVNLLSQTSVMGLTVPLIPVTWIWGPVAALNLASTITPALGALATFAVLRRWVRWTPAAYLGGLLYGFSPFVLTSLEFAHLMTAALMVLPLIVGALDEILVRQRHPAWQSGLVLGLLLVWQFFLSTELLAVLAVVLLIALAGLVLVVALTDRARRQRRLQARLQRRLPHAVRGVVVGVAVSGVLLVYPLWFALDGPAHLSGVIWPRLEALGGFEWGSFVGPHLVTGSRGYNQLGGYLGRQLPSAGYIGWGLLGVLVAGSLVWFRDRRLWFFGFVLAVCVLCSLIARPGGLEPAHLFAHIPLLDDVIEQRFMVFGFLAAAIMLAVIIDHVHDGLGRVRSGSWASSLVALGVAAVALVPIALTFDSALPFTMEAVTLPRWYTEVAPTLPPGRVLLSYPAPFSGIQVAMAWQSVDAMHYSQAGGGGPQGVRARAGSAAPGFAVLTRLAFGIGQSPPTGTPAQLAAVRHAIAEWRVDTVVIAPQPGAPFLLEGRDPTYAAALMTAALGRLPRIQAGAWVWNDVTGADPAATSPLAPTRLADCVARDEQVRLATDATLGVARCVLSPVADTNTGPGSAS